MSRLLLVVLLIVYVKGCYWNAPCHYQLFGSKTPYDAVRGDIRDHATPPNCKAVSIWTLNRHGNRHPDDAAISKMKDVASLKDEIISSFYNGNSQLCAQDIEDLKNWVWDDNMEQNPNHLTATGYKELYGIGKRVREKYSHLLTGQADEFYFRPTKKQRTIASAAAFVDGFTEDTGLNVTIEDANKLDEVIKGYEHCDRYQQEVKGGQRLAKKIERYFNSSRFLDVQNAVQSRLGIATTLNSTNVFAIYELCRFFGSWSPDSKSPWCAIFTDEELVSLEYHDDLMHYYRNGYGSWISPYIGRMPLRYLYDSFTAFVAGEGKKVSAHFTHDTMMEMVYSALGLNKDPAPLKAQAMDPKRLWRSSYVGAFSTNLIAVLNSCVEPGNDPNIESYRVQFFINELEVPICPPSEGCSWGEFQVNFKKFADADLKFCERDENNNNDVNDSSYNQSDTLRKTLWPWH